MKVALKVLMVEGGVTPSSAAIRNEIKIWSKIRHPHVLQFLGANVLDERPFIVMPYLANGNARDYLQEHPNADRLQILHGISLGLVHLHSLQIVHGDLKALNVLIDNSAQAVLCDFGLARVKADVTSRTARPDGGGVVGSRNWMAPERLLGGSLRKPCDIYAFGMTLHEIFANETPLGELSFSEFVELVVQRGVRPERPDDEDAPQLSDAVWELAERCWVKDPKLRPTASAVCDTLLHLLDTAAMTQPIPNPSSNMSQAPVQDSPPQLSNPPQSMILKGHTAPILCATFSSDGKYIVSGSSDYTIMVWDAQTGNLALGPFKRHTESVYCVAFSPNGRKFASGSKDKTILVWDAVTGKVVAGPMKGHTNSIWSVCFSPNGKQIASGSEDHSIQLWDAQTGYPLIGSLTGHTDAVWSVVFSGDGKLLVSGSADKTIRVWDVKSARLIWGPLRGHNNWVTFVAFSSNAKRIVSASKGGNVCVWNTDTGALVSGSSKQHEEGALARVFTPNNTWYCIVSPNGKWIADIGNDPWKELYVWDLKTGQNVVTFSDHTDYICSVTFSPDSKQILSASKDQTIQVHTLDL